MPEISFQALNIIAYSKVLLVIAFVSYLLVLRYKNRTWLLALLASVFLSAFYLILSFNFKKMWWGNNGDEIFIISFLSQSLLDNPLKDFFYHSLPAFYPPLYFWLTGIVSRPFVSNAISAAKIGLAITLFLWFIGTYYFQKIYQYISEKKIGTKLFSFNSRYFFIVPLLYLFILDFNDIILKPYETLPALLLVILIGFIAESFSCQKWSIKEYLFFAISGGLLFLSYYFWWFIAIPALFALVIFSENKILNLKRLIIIGLGIFLVAAIYIIPLFLSYLNGMENWQALYFVPTDFSNFFPFSILSWKGILMLIGLIGLVINYRKPFFRANLFILISCYLYQFVSIILFLSSKSPLQAAKPFLFLATATLVIGASKLLMDAWFKYIAPLSGGKRYIASVVILIFSLSFWPMASFMDDPVVRRQIDINLEFPASYYLANNIMDNVNEPEKRTWLSSGVPDINAYIPMKYFISHNPHFSHHAAKYSERLSFVDKLSNLNEEEFITSINNSEIDALLLYKQGDVDYFPIFFWQDNYPNGGKEGLIKIAKEKVYGLNWEMAYEDSQWLVYLK